MKAGDLLQRYLLLEISEVCHSKDGKSVKGPDCPRPEHWVAGWCGEGTMWWTGGVTQIPLHSQPCCLWEPGLFPTPSIYTYVVEPRVDWFVCVGSKQKEWAKSERWQEKMRRVVSSALLYWAYWRHRACLLVSVSLLLSSTGGLQWIIYWTVQVTIKLHVSQDLWGNDKFSTGQFF